MSNFATVESTKPKAHHLGLPDTRTDAQRKADRWEGYLFNPITLILGIICFPLWPFFVIAGGIYLFCLWTKNWTKGARFMEGNTVMIGVERHYCERDDIVFVNRCPKCNSMVGLPVDMLGRKPKLAQPTDGPTPTDDGSMAMGMRADGAVRTSRSDLKRKESDLVGRTKLAPDEVEAYTEYLHTLSDNEVDAYIKRLLDCKIPYETFSAADPYYVYALRAPKTDEPQ